MRASPGYGEADWGFGIEDVMLLILPDAIMGQTRWDIDPLYTQIILRTGGAGAIGGVTITAISGVEIALWGPRRKTSRSACLQAIGWPISQRRARLPHHKPAGFS